MMDPTFDFLYSLHQVVGTGLSLDDVEEKYIAAHGDFPIHKHLSVDGDTVNDLRRALLGLPHLLRIEGNTVYAIEPSSTREELHAVNVCYVENLAVKHKMYSAAAPGDLDLPLQAAVVALACGPRPCSDLSEPDFVRQRPEFDIVQKDRIELVQISPEAVENAKKQHLRIELASAANSAKSSDEKPTSSKCPTPRASAEKTAEEAKNHRERGNLCKMLLKGLAAILRERPLKLDMLQMAFDAKYRSVSKEPLQKLGYACMEDFVRNDVIAKRVIKVDDELCSLVRRATPAETAPQEAVERSSTPDRAGWPDEPISAREVSQSPNRDSPHPVLHARPRTPRVTSATPTSPPLSPPFGVSRSPSTDKLGRAGVDRAASSSDHASKGKQRSTLEENKQKLQQKLKQNREKLLLQKQKPPEDTPATAKTSGSSSPSTNPNANATPQAAIPSVPSVQSRAGVHAKLQEKLKLHQQKESMRDRLKERLTDKKVAVGTTAPNETPSLSAADKERIKDKLKEQLLAKRKTGERKDRALSPAASLDSMSPRSVQFEDLCSANEDKWRNPASSRKRSRSQSVTNVRKRSLSSGVRNGNCIELGQQEAHTRRDETQETFVRSVLEVFKWCKRPLTLRELRAHWEDAHPGCYMDTYCEKYGEDAVVEHVSKIPGMSVDRATGIPRFVYEKVGDEAIDTRHSDFESKIHIDPDDMHALGGSASLFARLHNHAIELTRQSQTQRARIRGSSKSQPTLLWRFESHDKEPWIRYTASSPSQAFPKISGSWCAGSLAASGNFGPISEHLGAKLSCTLKMAKWLARQRSLRSVSEFTQEEKNRLTEVHDLEIEDSARKRPRTAETKATSSQRPASDGTTTVEVCDDLSFCRLLIALHREKRAVGLSVGKRSLAVCTSKGTFVVRFLILDPAFKPAFSYSLASLVAPKIQSRRVGSDKMTVQVGGQWKGLGELLGEVWHDVVDACSVSSTATFITVEVQSGQGLAAQAREAWQILSSMNSGS